MIRKPVTRRLLLSRSGLALAGFPLATSATNAFGRPVEGIEVVVDPADGYLYFNDAQVAVLNDVADIMIPETDTPGAIASATIRYVDRMMTDWADGDTKAKFAYFIEMMDKMAQADGHASYLNMPRDAREMLVDKVDAEAFANRKEMPSIAYRKVKSLIFHVHYSSAEANPDYVLIPGGYYGNLSYEEYRQLIDERKLQQ